MKSSIIDQLNKLKSEALRFVEVSIEYAKFTAAEKFTMLGGMLVLGIVCLAMLAFVFIFLGFSCAELFKLFMPAALAYLSTAGVFLLLCILLILLRDPLILTPISRLLTRILFDTKNRSQQ